MKVLNLNFEARKEIRLLVEETWKGLLDKTKNVIDSSLMDGECQG